jgi:hypothetical protein
VSFFATYLSNVGTQTHDAMKVILCKLLMNRYRAVDADFAVKLAVAVANYLFCDKPSPDAGEARSFATANEPLIRSLAKELSSDEALCRALTCAAYNFCYGKYVDSGRKVGLLFHPFLGFVRSLQEVVRGNEPVSFLDSVYTEVGRENVEPLLNLWSLGLYRLLPYAPDSKLMLDEVMMFGESISPEAEP